MVSIPYRVHVALFGDLQLRIAQGQNDAALLVSSQIRSRLPYLHSNGGNDNLTAKRKRRLLLSRMLTQVFFAELALKLWNEAVSCTQSRSISAALNVNGTHSY